MACSFSAHHQYSSVQGPIFYDGCPLRLLSNRIKYVIFRYISLYLKNIVGRTTGFLQ